MNPSFELTDILQNLRRARSPVARLRILASAWRTIRQLTPEARKQLAKELGVEGAEEFVERLAASRGIEIPMMLRDTLEFIRQGDAGELRWALKRLRDADERSELVSDALRAVEEHALRATSTPPMATPVVKPRTVPLVTADVFDPLVDQELIESADEPIATAEASPTPVSAETPPLPESQASPASGEGSPETFTSADVFTPLHDEPVIDEPAPSESAALPDPADVWIKELAAVRRPSARLRLLRSSVAELEDLPHRDRLRVLDSFPDGWQRRRAVLCLLEAGLYDASAALDMIERLSAERDRRWCLSTMLRTWTLRQDEIDRALTLTSSSATRRRVVNAAAKHVT